MAVPSVLTDLSVSEGSNNPLDSETITASTRPSDYLRALGALLRREQAQFTAVASASSIDLGAITTGNYGHVTGTTTITSFGTVAAGIERTLVFDGILTLTHNATSLILATGANRTTAAGDVGVYVSEGSGNWREKAYHAIGSYQPLDADLTAIAALAKTDGNIIVGDGSTWVAESGATARASLGLATVGQAEAEAGTATTERAWTAERVAQAIAALADAGITLTTGAAPYYGCRAWVNFNGTGVVAINASGNVSSITDNGTGDYTINFTTAMPDANYTVGGSTMRGTSNSDNDLYLPLGGTYTAAACQVNSAASSSSVSLYDCEIVNVFFFR